MVRATLAALCAAIVFQGCSSTGGEGDANVVATGGDIKITLAEFQDAHNKITAENRPSIDTLEERRKFAQDLMNREILLAEARRAGGIQDTSIVNSLANNRRQQVLNLFYRQKIQEDVDVSGSDVAEVYKHRGFNIRLAHILVEDVATANKIRGDILGNSISFEDAAELHSLDLSSKDNDGRVGEILWSLTLPSFQKKGFELTPGEISEPFESEIGVHLLRVNERVTKDQPPLEDMRAGLRQDVRRQKETLYMQDYVRGLEEREGLTWDDEGIDTLVECIDAMLAVDIDEVARADQYIPTPTPEQARQAVARFSGRDWTVADYALGIRKQPPPNRPVGRLPRSGLKELIRSTQIQQEILYAEALAQGYGEHPSIVDQANRIEEQVLIEMVHSRFLQQADLTMDEAKAYYDSTLAADPNTFQFPEMVDMNVLIHADAGVVEEGLARIKNGEPEESVIADLSMDNRTKRRAGRTELIPRGTYVPELEDVAFTRELGLGWTDVIVTPTGSAILKVLAREPARTARFEEIEDELVRQLRQAQGERAFEAWLQSERERLNIKIHDDVLEKIGQPVS